MQTQGKALTLKIYLLSGGQAKTKESGFPSSPVIIIEAIKGNLYTRHVLGDCKTK